MHLTFDDGPDPRFTPEVLDLLDRYEAKATFFVLGSSAERYPELIAETVDRGHTIANHTWAHDDLTALSHDEFIGTVGRTADLLGPVAADCLRPPGGRLDEDTTAWAAELGLRLELWTVDTRDWEQPGVDSITAKVFQGAAPGAVVLMHDGGGDRSQSVAALALVLSDLTAAGWGFSPVCAVPDR